MSDIGLNDVGGSLDLQEVPHHKEGEEDHAGRPLRSWQLDPRLSRKCHRVLQRQFVIRSYDLYATKSLIYQSH